MSKSKKNVIDPDDAVATYGADAVRLMVLSDSPPDRDVEWSEAAADGCARFLQRIYRLASEPALPLPAFGTAAPATFSSAAQDLRRLTHRTIRDVTADYDSFRYNKAIARIREMANAIGDYKGAAGDAGDAWALRESLETLSHLFCLVVPHVAEEIWTTLGGTEFVSKAPWPTFEAALTEENTVTIAVQVNGKLRATITLPKGTDQKTAETTALADEGVKRALDGKSPRKVIVVPDRIVNIVA
jgi:leucyl-tRNA synthetase